MFNIPQNSFYAMVAVLGLLIFSSLICVGLAFKNPEKNYRELKQRIQSWWWMVGILFVCIGFGRNMTIVLFASISFLALKEFFSIVPTRQIDRRVIFWAYLCIPLQYYLISIQFYGVYIVLVPVWVFLILPMRMVMLGETKGFIHSAGVMHWAVMLTVFCLSHVAYLSAIPVKNTEAGWVGVIIFLIFMTEFNDVCQYVWGKLFGKRKIIPKVSPNKTWVGFLGGITTVTIVSAFAGPKLTPLTGEQSCLAGFIISFSGFIGDVVLSAIKRDLDIKDTGSLIPGHGGMLDRLDSLFFTAPVFFHYLYYVAY